MDDQSNRADDNIIGQVVNSNPVDSGNRYTPRELAKLFPGVSTENLRSWEDTGKISSAIKTPGGHRRFTDVHVAEIERYMGPASR